MKMLLLYLNRLTVHNTKVIVEIVARLTGEGFRVATTNQISDAYVVICNTIQEAQSIAAEYPDKIVATIPDRNDPETAIRRIVEGRDEKLSSKDKQALQEWLKEPAREKVSRWAQN